MSNWKHIETAPTDGIPKLMYEPHNTNSVTYLGGFMYVGVNTNDGEDWLDTMTLEKRNPSHWMPLPAPPEGT